MRIGLPAAQRRRLGLAAIDELGIGEDALQRRLDAGVEVPSSPRPAW